MISTSTQLIRGLQAGLEKQGLLNVFCNKRNHGINNGWLIYFLVAHSTKILQQVATDSIFIFACFLMEKMFLNIFS